MKVVIMFPMYHTKVVFVIGEYDDNIKSFPAIYRFDDEMKGLGYMARTAHDHDDNGSPRLIFVHSRTAAMSVIAHEAVHVASIIFKRIGAKADWDNDEHVAYVVQYITEKVEDALIK